MWTAFPGHESRHGGTDTELAGLVVAGRDDAAVSSSAHGDRSAGEFRTLSHLHGGVEAVHVEMDDFSHRLVWLQPAAITLGRDDLWDPIYPRRACCSVRFLGDVHGCWGGWA